jgi:hypothetical protein
MPETETAKSTLARLLPRLGAGALVAGIIAAAALGLRVTPSIAEAA